MKNFMRILFLLVLLLAVSAPIFLLFSGCSSTIPVRQTTETIVRDSLISVKVPRLETKLTDYKLIYPGDFTLLYSEKSATPDSSSAPIGKRYKKETSEYKIQVDVMNDGTVAVKEERADIKQPVQVSSTVTNKTELKEEKGFFEKSFDFLKSFIFYIVIAGVLIIIIPILIRLTKLKL